jgi:hypothetical protein
MTSQQVCIGHYGFWSLDIAIVAPATIAPYPFTPQAHNIRP